jgi:hypothetical protein
VRRAGLALLLVLAACSGDDEEPATLDGEWDVVFVVGAADADPAADASAVPDVGSDASERWTFTCDGAGCTLSRPAGGLLGTLDGLRLEAADESMRGEATDVRAGASPCAGSPAETWTVQVELTLEENTFVGSVFRIPDALVAGECFGVDLTLGLSGSRR